MKHDTTVGSEALSSHQKLQSTTAVLDAVSALGGPSAFIKALDLDKLTFASLMTGDAYPDSFTSERIYILTSGRIALSDLRPDLYPADDGEGVDVTHLLGADRDQRLSQADIDRVAEAVIGLLETRAWSAFTAANAEHEKHPTPKNKGRVVAAFNRFANIVGAETV